jgi:hypothetical protein
MSDEDNYEPYQIREMVDALIIAGEQELNRLSELKVPRLILGRDFGTFCPWVKEDLDCALREALAGNGAAEARLLNSAATSDGPASRYITWLYALLFWFRENPEHLDQVENVLRFGRERGVVAPASEFVPREPRPQTSPCTGGFFDGIPNQVS